MDVMYFISDHYIWFVVIAVIIVMTLIGYIADKTNFVSKQKDTTKKKKEKVEKQKKQKVSKTREKMAKEIGDGKNFVMEENEVNYPVEMDREPVVIDIPKAIEEPVIDEIPRSEENVDMPIYEPTGNGNISHNIITDHIEEPLVDGVLHLDDFDANKDDHKTVEESVDIVSDLNEQNDVIENVAENETINEESPKENIGMQDPTLNTIPEVSLDPPAQDYSAEEIHSNVEQVSLNHGNNEEITEKPKNEQEIEIPEIFEPTITEDQNAKETQAKEENLSQTIESDDMWKF